MKIATLTYQRHDNYGAMLQCYALQKKLESMGVDTQVIDYVCEVSEKPFGLRALKAKGIKRYITGCIGAVTRLPRAKSFKKFRKLINMTDTVTEKNISQIGACFDGYIVGSDNVWNADITGLDERYFLSFVADKRRRASFAASFGSSDIKEQHRESYIKLLSEFAVLNCREKSGAQLIETLTGKETNVVCDPSFLLTPQQWRALAVPTKEKKPYMLVYQMVPSGAFVKTVKKIAKQRGLRIVYLPFPYGMLKCKIKPSIGPLEWLGLFNDAEYVVTDSFHGCAFSIMLGKQFSVCISQLGERIENILSVTGLSDRLIKNAQDDAELGKIDYSSVEPRLTAFRQFSEDKLGETVKYFESLDQNGIIDPSSCTGCMLCKNVCKAKAIDVRRDELGFLYPEINSELCINCKICEKVCELLSPVKREEQQYYAVINKDKEIVKNSGSGGMFFELANLFVNSNGAVYGAAYSEGFAVFHERADSIEGVKRLMGTKYTQSSIDEIFQNIAQDIKQGKKVLFVGTPCQCDAVRTYLRLHRIDDTLLTVCDLFCHGVFSPQIWSEYISFLQSRFDDKITYISFRDKEKGWRNKHFKILMENRDISDFVNNEGSVLRLYEQNICLRESCYRCKYMNFDRVGDISIGDFWGIERVKPEMDNNTGVSAVIVNTDKGREIFAQISPNVNITEFDKESIVQQVLREPTRKHSKRNNFIADYKTGGLQSILTKYGQVKGLLHFKRDVFVPFLYKVRLAGLASKILHRND